MNAPAWSIVLGACLGIGLWCIASVLPRLSAPSLADRVAPYIVDVSEAARVHSSGRQTDPLPLLGSLFAPLARRVIGLVTTVAGGNHSIRARLDQLGSDMSVHAFRSQQLVWAVGGGGIGVVLGALALVNRTGQAMFAVILPLLFAAIGWMLRDLLLRRAARKRAARISEELPTVLEFLSLSLSAGEGIIDALRRVATVGSGELSAEFGRVVADVRTGVPLAAALTGCARRADVAALGRAIEQLIVALDRGAPLADVLRLQAQDVRDETKRVLLESAGKKEVAMLVPLVFFILPLSVLFAIFPGIFVLQAGF